MGLIAEIKRRRARGDRMRPWWQIVPLLLLYPFYAGMRWIVDKVEGR